MKRSEFTTEYSMIHDDEAMRMAMIRIKGSIAAERRAKRAVAAVLALLALGDLAVGLLAMVVAA